LEVLNRREDGYHTMRSVMVPLAFGDELEIEPSEALSFRCSDPSLENDANLVARALRSLDPALKATIALNKRVPSQAGLGGGSSDAAALLRAAAGGAFLRTFNVDWVAVARSLGSDVPFFLVESAALVEGTGERVTATGSLPPWHVLVVKPPVASSTAAAYREIDARSRPTRSRSDSVSLQMLAALQRGDFAGVEALLSNDFHDPIAESLPEVAEAIDALRQAGAHRVLLAGSGSAVFTIAREANDIATIADRLSLDERYQRIVTQFARSDAWQ
ncbi:MAG TPA: 4-(cytidine 5'-diphospho)-2-C-methyl-D-erythritol kinase, partial [Candidatus Baltobacteraceae bacterium]|nr:4-(cytidine 5'-diphospho)-2-C-methyl-D-erythritol kinase [Candidatus Baltobacteraceae bacterium]